MSEKHKSGKANWRPWVSTRTYPSGETVHVLSWHERKPDGGRILRRKHFATPDALDAWQAGEAAKRNQEARLARQAERRGDSLVWWARHTEADRASIMKAVAMLVEAGGNTRSISAAVQHFIESKLRGATVTVEEAANEYLDRLSQTRRRWTVIDRKSRLKTFVEEYGASRLTAIDAPTIEDWIFSTTNPALQGARRRAVSTLFSFAVRRKNIRENPMAHVEVVEATAPDTVAIMPPADVEKVLRTAERIAPQMIPFFAVAFFAGLRPENEIRGLDWGNIDLRAGGKIRVVRSTSKRKRTRYTPIAENLRAWLLTVPRKERIGTLFYSRRLFRRVVESAGVTWPPDVARHTFCTFRMVQIKNIFQLVEEAGNTPDVARAHYLAPQESEADAKRFWNIKPSKDGGRK